MLLSKPPQLLRWRASIEKTKSRIPYFARLKDVSLDFLESPHAIAAIDHGWTDEQLFGLSRLSTPNLRTSHYGLIATVAFSPHGDTISAIDADGATLKTISTRHLRDHAGLRHAAAFWRYDLLKS